MNAHDVLLALTESSNTVAAGVGECVRAFAGIVHGGELTGPVLIEFGDRTLALGRKRMGTMSGRNAFVYLKSKFGLLNASTPLYLQALFVGNNKWCEVDMDSWEELVPFIQKLRIAT